MLAKHALRPRQWSLGYSLVHRACLAHCLVPLLPTCSQNLPTQERNASSSSSSKRWKTRQDQDQYSKEAKVQGLKSRAAFKLLQINDKHRLFKKGDTVVDLGFAPGSWSQVAANRTSPRGRVIGVDVIPAQPPRGVSSIQGDFLSPEIQAEVRTYVQDGERGRPRKALNFSEGDDVLDESAEVSEPSGYIGMSGDDAPDEPGAPASSDDADKDGTEGDGTEGAETEVESMSRTKRDEARGRVVDVVLSDMDEPWDQTSGFGSKSISNAYRRMMSTSGVAFKDHVGSMDLCTAALSFGFDTLKSGGHFVCKFYQGAEDKILEKRLRRLFEKVYRDKPSASRSESREGFFVALRRKELPTKNEVFAE